MATDGSCSRCSAANAGAKRANLARGETVDQCLLELIAQRHQRVDLRDNSSLLGQWRHRNQDICDRLPIQSRPFDCSLRIALTRELWKHGCRADEVVAARLAERPHSHRRIDRPAAHRRCRGCARAGPARGTARPRSPAAPRPWPLATLRRRADSDEPEPITGGDWLAVVRRGHSPLQ